MSESPDELAERCADALWRDDPASRGLGMTLVAVSAGRATISMPVRDDMTNGHGTAHGGFIFSLADSAFAVACNSRNERSVAQACDIIFAAPAHAGDVLVAQGVERHRFGRNGIYDITVSRDGQVIAEFRGRCRNIGGPVVGDA